MISDYQWTFLKNVAKLIVFAESKGYKLTGGWLKRDEEIQKRLYNEGLSLTLNSNHIKSLAIDLNIFKNGNLTYDKKDIEELGKYWKSLNGMNRWGGDWMRLNDTGHFEMNI